MISRYEAYTWVVFMYLICGDFFPAYSMHAIWMIIVGIALLVGALVLAVVANKNKETKKVWTSIVLTLVIVCKIVLDLICIYRNS